MKTAWMIGAMGDRIGLFESVHEARVVERDVGHALAGERTAHLHAGRPMGIGEHRFLEAEPFERAEDVGAELDAGADLLEFRRLFQHPHREALARKRIAPPQARRCRRPQPGSASA